MAVLKDELWDTNNNREAEGQSPWRGSKRDIDISESFEGPEEEAMEAGEGEAEEETEGESTELPFNEDQLMNLMRSAYAQGTSHQQSILQPRWQRSYNSWNNQHNTDSKYSSVRFRGRSHLYRPKTRATVRKKSAEAAAAMFSTSDAIIISAANPSDKVQQASAAVQQELINYRLDRSNENAGIPWFMICMGAHLTAQLTAITISKQFWEYKTVETTRTVIVEEPMTLPAAAPGLEPVMLGYIQKEQQVTETRVVRDRPRVMLFPPEDCIRDPAAAWEDQAQGSAYLILRHPMPLTEARAFLEQTNPRSAQQFLPLDDATLAAAAGKGKSDSTGAAATRRARDHGGDDRYASGSVDKEFDTVWLHENFLKIEGDDYVFWTLGTEKLISNVVKVEEAYPEQGGARPVTIGVSVLDPFKVDPMAPVESWQPMQQEMNDLVNLRLDTLKQSIAPLAKVRRGRAVDVKAIQNRSPDTVVYVQEHTDIEFDRPGDVSQASYAEMEKLNADFDDQAGNFSIGSVQTNRQLGETVGGMKMMSSNANALGEFDLRVWIETWVEPVLRQLVKLEQYYESDEIVLAIAGDKAKIRQKFGIDQVTDDLLTQQVTLTVNVGIGAADPMLSLDKFAKATQIVGGIVGQALQQRIKQDAVIDEVYGKAGYKNASERFFLPMPQEDPRLTEAQQVIQQLQGALEEAQKALEDKAEEQKTKKDVAKINALAGLAKQEMSQQQQADQQFVDAAMGQVNAEQDREFQREQATQGRQNSLQDRALDAFQTEQAAAAAPAPAPAPAQGQDGMQQLAEAIMQGMQQIAQSVQQSNEAVIAAIESIAGGQNQPQAPF